MKSSTDRQENALARDNLIASYINQLLKIYPNYSDGSDTNTKIRAFQFTLRDSATYEFPVEFIDSFFKEWIKTQRKMPMPADALDYCLEKYKHKQSVKFIEKNVPALPKPKNSVPWYGMKYNEILNSNYRQQFEKHLCELRELRGDREVNNYILYLKNHVG